MTSYRTGLQAEYLAAWMLRLKGYKIIAQRYKTPVGEIDLIAKRGRALVFVEVKARGSLNEALESLRSHQSRRILRAADYYMAHYRAEPPEIRFDVIAINPPFRIRHIKAAFSG